MTVDKLPAFMDGTENHILAEILRILDGLGECAVKYTIGTYINLL